MMKVRGFALTILIVGVATAAYQLGQSDGALDAQAGNASHLLHADDAVAALASNVAAQTDRSQPTPAAANYSRTGAVQNRTVYYPGTEDLAPDEMRVVCCGSGMPRPVAESGGRMFPGGIGER